MDETQQLVSERSQTQQHGTMISFIQSSEQAKSIYCGSTKHTHDPQQRDDKQEAERLFLCFGYQLVILCGSLLLPS